MKGTNAYNNGLEQSIPLIKPPRTGIEQVFLSDRPRFIEATREFERLANVNVSLFHSSSSGCLPINYILKRV